MAINKSLGEWNTKSIAGKPEAEVAILFICVNDVKIVDGQQVCWMSNKQWKPQSHEKIIIINAGIYFYARPVFVDTVGDKQTM